MGRLDTRFMRVRLAILAAVLPAAMAAAVRAAPPGSASLSAADAGPAQVRAAQANAMSALRESVLRMDVGRGLKVRDVVDRTGSADQLTRALSAARPLGGPRWVDEQTCQVQVTVSGAAVADAVAGMATRYPGGRLPVRPADLNARLANWRMTAFTATGSSVAGGAGLQQARPRQLGGRWASVPDAVRRRTVADAQADAVRLVLDDLRPTVGSLPLGGSTARATDAVARPFVVGQVRTYLGSQPVTKIEFLDDLTVSLSIAVDARSLAQVVERAVTDDQPRLSSDATKGGEWTAIRAAIERAVPTVVTGTASAAPPAAGGGNLPAVVLPMQPPGAFDGLLEGDGSAVAPVGVRSNRLKVAGMAHAAAVAQLRERLLALHVTNDLTLADAARADPQLSAAVSKVLLDAQDDKVELMADGSVRVHAHLNLRDAWDQLRSSP